MNRKIVLIILFALSSAGLWAQGGKRESGKENRGPDLQTVEPDFFDPTRKEPRAEYHFAMEYRLQAGYVQHWQRSQNKSFTDMYLHGGELGMTFDFMLPYRFSAQTGVLYTVAYGTSRQKWGPMSPEDMYANTNYLRYRVTEHQLAIPMRVFYNIKLWRQLNLFFYTGPQLMIGLAQTTKVDNRLTAATALWASTNFGQRLSDYDRYWDKQLWAANIQWGLGGGIEWDCYRLQAGYDFGLNNIVREKQVHRQKLHEWSWYVSFCYRLPIH